MSLEVAFSLGGRVVLPVPFRDYAHLRRTLVASYYKRHIPSHMSKSHRRFLAIVCKHLRASPDIFLSRSSATLAHASSKPRSIGEPDDPIIRESRGVSRSTDLIIRQSTPVFEKEGRRGLNRGVDESSFLTHPVRIITSEESRINRYSMDRRINEFG